MIPAQCSTTLCNILFTCYPRNKHMFCACHVLLLFGTILVDCNHIFHDYKVDGLAQDFSNSCALAMDLLQSCTKPWSLHLPHGQWSNPEECRKVDHDHMKIEKNHMDLLWSDTLNSTKHSTTKQCVYFMTIGCITNLTHWGRVTHICVGNLTIIGPDNGLSPGRRQAIIWTNAGILLIGPWGTNFS